VVGAEIFQEIREHSSGDSALRSELDGPHMGDGLGNGDKIQRPGSGADSIARARAFEKVSALIRSGSVLSPEFDEATALLQGTDATRVFAAYRLLERKRTRERAAWIVVATRLPEGTGLELLSEVLDTATEGEAAPNVDVDGDPDDDPQLPELLAVEGLAEIGARVPSRKDDARSALTRVLGRELGPEVRARVDRELQNLK
jgi:hypothetical protein